MQIKRWPEAVTKYTYTFVCLCVCALPYIFNVCNILHLAMAAVNIHFGFVVP